ncbi:hypothetical protein IVA95_37480 [Bradyrhizobium sp. 157]|uniref:hypothetical protein n=1 Tax=Bradyrhizobium sp. 157 TaxID=2782631 RepID=UPI001FFA4C15|nr:hypothetical protein [Bradyrhizobium sp. 157]MCK1643103.1 hypothetical protein [Bradyrhizobium sp. 157]
MVVAQSQATCRSPEFVDDRPLTVELLLPRATSPALSEWSGLETDLPRFLRRRQRDQRFSSLHAVDRLNRFGEKPFELAWCRSAPSGDIPGASDVMAFQYVG